MFRSFSVLGDSNVRRHLNKVNCRSNPLMKASQLIPCGHIEILSESLGEVRAESNVVILSCITNFFTSIPDGSSTPAGLRVEPVLSQFQETVSKACKEKPDIAFMVCPPMYRTHPSWYRDGLSEILNLFSSSLGRDQDLPPNLYLLPSFPTPSFESDGVHLSAYSGLEFVLHLFDSAQDVLDGLSLDPSVQTSKVQEAHRSLEDRMMVLEQDHRRLAKGHEMKSAADAELHDWHQNERWEDFFMIKGLALLPSAGISSKEWQDRAVKDVQKVLQIVMGAEVPIVYVLNATNKLRDTVATYHVQLAEVSLSKAIRLRFSGYFQGKEDLRPEPLKKISIRNRITQETHVRISIFHLFGQRYVRSNSGAQYKVLGYRPRPVLKIFPASDAKDRKIRSYTFMEAVRQLPSDFPAPDLEELIKRVPFKLIGRLRDLFVVLSDDLARLHRKNSSDKSEGTNEASASNEPEGSSASETAPPAFNSRKRPPSPSGSKKSKRGK